MIDQMNKPLTKEKVFRFALGNYKHEYIDVVRTDDLRSAVAGLREALCDCHACSDVEDEWKIHGKCTTCLIIDQWLGAVEEEGKK